MTTLATTTHALFIAVGRATEQGYAVVFVSPKEWGEWYVEEQKDCHDNNQLMSIWQPLADLGWQNFICGGDHIIVRFEVVG
jgi:hypothetical protein